MSYHKMTNECNRRLSFHEYLNIFPRFKELLLIRNRLITVILNFVECIIGVELAAFGS